MDGLEHIPLTGPVVLASRHVHHALDGALLLAVAPRRLHAMVAVDWARPGLPRRIIDRACRLLGWPTVLRPSHPGATDPDEAARMLRRATREAIALLRDGQTLLVFPEGYPNVDPHWTPKPDLDAWLPFDPGFAHLVRLAQRNGAPPTPVVPVGFHYWPGRRWRIVARFGAPRFLPPDADLAVFVAEIEACTRALSEP
ncbi:MAG TPA: 1-acyl-sn-glycerol-3-phosphate acyltransferase [Thermomicrobiales bacterium]|nr:1-acyl-sn-glycerol-3-phosphate acyltransferase [Thermomicrobiales bacterium]